MCFKLSNLYLTFGNTEIFKDVNIVIERGFNIIIGPSGSGKSSFLKILNLMELPSSGTVLYKNRPLIEYIPSKIRSLCVLVRQKPVFALKKVEDNLKLPFSFKSNMHKRFDYKLLYELLDRFMLEKSILKKESHTISGGEMQRLSFIRAVMLKPQVFLLDEVTSALDESMQNSVFEYIKFLSENHICVVSTHSNSAFRYADSVFKIQDKGVVND